MTSGADPARQSLARPLTPAEQALAEALEGIFSAGQHDFEMVVVQLNSHGVARPSGQGGDWTVAVLEDELKTINAALDAAYEAGGTAQLP
jgi:hypothetical protein